MLPGRRYEKILEETEGGGRIRKGGGKYQKLL